MKFKNLSWVLSFLTIAIQFDDILSARYASAGFFTRLEQQDRTIVGGNLAISANNRHHVSIRNLRAEEELGFGLGHICSGSLIAENVVLSAAHCFIDQIAYDGTFLGPDKFLAVMGNHNRLERDVNTLEFPIRKIVKYHTVFNTRTYDQDIVLLMLDGKVPAQHPTIQTISLNGGGLKAGTTCIAAGWGSNSQNMEQTILMSVEYPLIPYDTCRKKNESIHQGMLCAGFNDDQHEVCLGDTGGPLVCNGRQAGIGSWGSGCSKSLKVGVYTDVAYFKKWILENVKANQWILDNEKDHQAKIPTFVGSGSISNTKASIGFIAFTLILSAILKM